MPLGSKPQLSRLSNSAFFSQVKIYSKKNRLLAGCRLHGWPTRTSAGSFQK